MRKQKRCLGEIIVILVVLQVLLFLFQKAGMLLSKNHTPFSDKMITMAGMFLLTMAVCIYAKFRKVELSVFPVCFNKKYVFFSVLALLFFIATPSNYIDGGKGFLILLYGSIVTPVYEEVLFRGLLWNMLKTVWNEDNKVLYINAFLFAVWHLGYIVLPLMKGEWLALTKLGIGLVYGVILCMIRKRTHNCYSTMLVHGVMNAFLG